MAATNTAPLGVFVGNPNDADPAEQAATKAQFNAFVSAMGRAPTFMDTFIDESGAESLWVASAQFSADSWKASPWLAGVTPVIGLPMASQAQAGNPGAVFAAITAGTYDAVYNGIFHAWAADGYTDMVIRPGYEMNGEWSPWFAGNGNEAAFRSAFSHISTLAHNFVGASIKVDYSPAVYWGSEPYAAYNPGAAATDIVGPDLYSDPGASGVGNPGDTSTDPNNLTMTDALNLAKSEGKPFAMSETGSAGDSSFPTSLAQTINASGVPVAFTNIWDFSASDGDWNFTGEPAMASETTAWKAGFGTSSTVPPSKLSLVLSEDAFKGNAKFIAKVDGVTIGGPTAVTASHALGQTQTFTFSGLWGPGNHSVEIDFTNAQHNRTASRDLYVNQVNYNGSPFLSSPHEMTQNGAFTVPVH